jgi:hypothetical protein
VYSLAFLNQTAEEYITEHATKLNPKLQEMRNESFEKYVSNLKREDKSICKPIKNRRKPKTTSSPIRKYAATPGSWAKSGKEKAELFSEHLFRSFLST